MRSSSIPYESDCINSRLGYPNSWKTLPDWVNPKIEKLKNDGRKTLLVNNPFISANESFFKNIIKVSI